ncbi:hypothetical protein ES702_02566 [subsurface metagenome]
MTKGIAVKCLDCGLFMQPDPIEFHVHQDKKPKDIFLISRSWKCLKCGRIVYVEMNYKKEEQIAFKKAIT